ncbi:MAG: aspartate/glutamate racemase family protein, partial [Deltaproteobacteria bacterium]
MEQKTLGILGGMGPLASLAFLRTIYECNLLGSIEQDYPNIVLHSLSSVPDRTRSLLGNAENALADSLVRNLRILNASGVSNIVICCFTSHALISRIPKEIAEKIVSLVDLTARELIVRKERALLLASLGSYQREVFRSTEDAIKA